MMPHRWDEVLVLAFSHKYRLFVKKWLSEQLINENETKQRRDERNTVQPCCNC